MAAGTAAFVCNQRLQVAGCNPVLFWVEKRTARQQQRTSFTNAITIPPFQDHASLAMHLHTANPKWPRQPAVTSAVWRSLIPLHHSSCTVFRPPAAPRPSADTQRGGLRRGLAGEVVGRDGAGAAVHDAGGGVPAELDGARVVAWSGLGLGLGLGLGSGSEGLGLGLGLGSQPSSKARV